MKKFRFLLAVVKNVSCSVIVTRLKCKLASNPVPRMHTHTHTHIDKRHT